MVSLAIGASEGPEQQLEDGRRYSQEGETPGGANGRRGQGRWPAVGNGGRVEVGKRQEKNT